ncbi:hypothetical protein [Glycomyces sp. NRRL B-16210]|uniref:hypothetical protein n=1 Tax=Glycomyces sp. NRRL B-16210 TaxID=1463821 RepID=UPI0004C1478F|nr:hypothetical protein [Glycomyces sp. NRRL B-16210]
MSQQRPEATGPGGESTENAVSRVLWQASHGYDDLPDPVAGRLDRVLDSLPAADTLHSAADPAAHPARENRFERWAERLRPKRVRYAVLSATAAVAITVVAVAVALQFVTASDRDATGAVEQAQSEEYGGAEKEPAPGAAPETDMDGQALEDDGDAGVGGITGIETFATGADYEAGADLLAALRGLGDGAATGPVPDELAVLAAGGDFWRACERAIAAEYEGVLIAVDFARYESQPAIMALLVSDGGDMAVALSPACAEGIIEALAVQP